MRRPLSLWLDVAIRVDCLSRIRRGAETIQEHLGVEIHTLRYEFDVITGEYRDLKKRFVGDLIQGLKYNIADSKGLIIDIDNHLAGNEYVK